MRRMIAFVTVLLVLCISFARAAQTSPELVVSAPSDGATINGTDVGITFQVSGLKLVPSVVPLAEAGKRPDANRPGEGHLHFVLDLQPLVVWERDTPYTFTNVAPGEHQLMIELVNNDHSPLAPQVMQQIRFRTAVMMPETGDQDGWLGRTLAPLGLLIALALLGVGWLLHSRNRPVFINPLVHRRDK